jgi:rsbT co-antagonist protein RsbR
MKRNISYEEIERDIADLNEAMKTVKKDAKVEKALNNLLENVKFQTNELKKREEEIRRLGTIVENSGTPAILLDPESRWKYVNPIFEKFFGFRKEEVLGKTTFETPIMTEEARKIITDQRKLYGKRDVVTYEAPFVKKSGELVHVLVTQTCMYDKKGEVTDWVVELKDITELRKREEKLKKSQEYTRALFYSIPNPTTILDLDGRRIDTAKATEDLFRMPREKILESKVEELYKKEDLEKIRETMERGKKGYSSCEATCIRGDGTHFPAILSFAPVKDKDGNLINIAFSATDVTELKRHEEELENTKVFLEDLINSVPDMIGVLDEESKWIKVNPAWEKIWGWKPEEMLGKKTEEQPFELPEMRKGVEERTRSRTDKLSRGETTEEELIFLAKDGSKRVGQFREQWMKYKGKITGRVVSIRDITELKEREEKLKKSQEYTRALFYSIPNPTTILDLDGRRIDTAKATEDLFRMPREKILESKVEELYKKEDLEKIRETMERGKKGYSSCEATCIRGDGTHFPAILSFAPVKDKDGNLINIAFSATDVTELKKATEDLENLLKELSTPCIKMSEQIVTMPLVGTITSDRARDAMQTVLTTISKSNARVAIIDVTGVPVIDTMAADRLSKTIKAIGILGAEAVLTGVSPEIAATLVGLGVELDVVMEPSLAEGLSYALEFLGKEIKEKAKASKSRF